MVVEILFYSVSAGTKYGCPLTLIRLRVVYSMLLYAHLTVLHTCYSLNTLLLAVNNADLESSG